MEDSHRQKLLALVAKLEAEDQAQMMARAVGWIVLSHDDEIDHNYVVGIFDQPAAAIEYEARMRKEMEGFTGEGQKGWTLSVLPVMPPV